jgi:hypothetical protein
MLIGVDLQGRLTCLKRVSTCLWHSYFGLPFLSGDARVVLLSSSLCPEHMHAPLLVTDYVLTKDLRYVLTR